MKAFSLDLRTRVVASIDNGMHINEAVKFFNVSRRTIYEWLELRRKTGSLQAKTGYQKGRSSKIQNWNQFIDFAYTNQQYSSPQLIIKWEELTGIKVSESVMLRALKKIGFTSKKKLLIILKQVRKSEQAF